MNLTPVKSKVTDQFNLNPQDYVVGLQPPGSRNPFSMIGESGVPITVKLN